MNFSWKSTISLGTHSAASTNVHWMLYFEADQPSIWDTELTSKNSSPNKRICSPLWSCLSDFNQHQSRVSRLVDLLCCMILHTHWLQQVVQTSLSHFSPVNYFAAQCRCTVIIYTSEIFKAIEALPASCLVRHSTQNELRTHRSNYHLVASQFCLSPRSVGFTCSGENLLSAMRQ